MYKIMTCSFFLYLTEIWRHLTDAIAPTDIHRHTLPCPPFR